MEHSIARKRVDQKRTGAELSARRAGRIRARRRGRSVRGSPTEVPSTTISPAWNGSRPFTQRSSVLFPLPEGPIRATTSPLRTERLTPRKRGFAPNDL